VAATELEATIAELQPIAAHLARELVRAELDRLGVDLLGQPLALNGDQPAESPPPAITATSSRPSVMAILPIGDSGTRLPR
jgi:hypothetical protein